MAGSRSSHEIEIRVPKEVVEAVGEAMQRAILDGEDWAEVQARGRAATRARASREPVSEEKKARVRDQVEQDWERREARFREELARCWRPWATLIRIIPPDTDACRSPIPIQADHRFRRMAITDSDMPIGDSDMPITDSDACRSLWSERVGALDNPL